MTFRIPLRVCILFLGWLTRWPAEKRFNRRQDEFESLLDYNNYLEEIETLTFNLLYEVDVANTEAKLSAYAAQNATSIAQNNVLRRQESASLEARESAEKEAARSRREAARREEVEDRREREESKREALDKVARGEAAPETLARPTAAKAQPAQQRVVLKKSSARRNPPSAAAPASQQQDNRLDSGSDTFFIKGLKPATAPASTADEPYDPFGGVSDRKVYYALQDHYEHPWLDDARTNPQIVAGGYDVKEYYARTLLEAFAGLGCFIGEEKADDASAVGTAGAAAVAGGEGDMGLNMDVVR